MLFKNLKKKKTHTHTINNSPLTCEFFIYRIRSSRLPTASSLFIFTDTKYAKGIT